MRYVCPYLNAYDESIKHAERVINASPVGTSKLSWWINYKHKLLKLMLKHQLLEFSKNN